MRYFIILIFYSIQSIILLIISHFIFIAIFVRLFLRDFQLSWKIISLVFFAIARMSFWRGFR
jgi:hypothetical protein